MKGNREAPPRPLGQVSFTTGQEASSKPFYATVNKRPRKAVRFVQDGSWQVVLQSSFPSLPEDYKIYLRRQSSTGLYHARQTNEHLSTTYGTGTTPDSALVNLCQNLKAVDRLLNKTDWLELRPMPRPAPKPTPVGKVFKRIGYVFTLSLALYGLHSFVSLLQLL